MTKRNVRASQMLTREEAAQALRVSVSTIDRYLRDGTIPRVKIGKRLVRIDSASLDQLLAEEKTALAEGGDAA